MVVGTVFTIYSLVEINNTTEYGTKALMAKTTITVIVIYGFTIFFLFCLTKIINFLFDLEERQVKLSKTDTNRSFVFANGDEYEGGWKNGLMHGKGTLIKINGTRKDGIWEDGNFIGE